MERGAIPRFGYSSPSPQGEGAGGRGKYRYATYTAVVL